MKQAVSILAATQQHREDGLHGISHIIALHGLGASVSDLKPLASTMHLPHVHWHFMAAPTRPVTINAGVLMPAWFDIYGFKENSPVDHTGIHGSCQVVLHHLKELVEHQGVNPRQIALLGFSQGGVVALHAGLVAPWKLGAIVGLSTWLPAKEGLCVSPSYLDLPIWLGHGIHDDVVPYSAAERAKKMLLSQMMTQVTLTHWSMGHSIHHEEIIALKDWLLSLDAPTGKHNHHAGGHHTGGHH